MSNFITSVNQSLASLPGFSLGGLQPFVWACIYLAALVVICVVVILLVVRHKRCGKFYPGLLKKWQKQMPDSTSLLALWPQIPEENRFQAAELCQQQNWCQAYLQDAGQRPASYQLILALWPYINQQQDELLHAMIEELASTSPEQSLAVSGLLKEIKDERVVPLLLVALLQNDRFLPARVCDALSAFGAVSGRALEALYDKVDRNDIEKKGLILDALGQLQAFCPVVVLQKAMVEPTWQLRKKAAEVIALVQPEQVVSFIQPLLQDAEGKVRAAAAAALSEIGGEQVVVTLQRLAEQDADWQVKTTCQTFLSRWQETIQNNVTVDEADLWLKDRSNEPS